MDLDGVGTCRDLSCRNLRNIQRDLMEVNEDEMEFLTNVAGAGMAGRKGTDTSWPDTVGTKYHT